MSKVVIITEAEGEDVEVVLGRFGSFVPGMEWLHESVTVTRGGSVSIAKSVVWPKPAERVELSSVSIDTGGAPPLITAMRTGHPMERAGEYAGTPWLLSSLLGRW